MPPQQVIFFIIGTVIILFGAYYVTYFIGMKASGQTRAGMRNRNIIVRDRYAISRDKSFFVIEIAGKVYIVGTTNNAMSLLDTYSADEFAELTKNTSADLTQMPWGDTPVGRYGNKLTQKVVSFIASKTGKGPRNDDKADFSESMKAAEQKSAGSCGPEARVTDQAKDRAPEDD